MSKLIKRDYVIELIKNSYYDLANSEDDMWAMVADVEKLPVIETEDLSHNKKYGGLKSDFRVIDALIDSMAYELSEVRDELNRVQSEMRILRNQYERLKKEYKESQKGEQHEID